MPSTRASTNCGRGAGSSGDEGHRPPRSFSSDLASSLNNLAIALGDLGRREEALAAIEEATGIYRDLAAARPDVYRPDLALSLNNATVKLAEEVGYDKVADLAKAAGISSVKATPAMALGAYDATPLDMAAAYTVFANGGARVMSRSSSMPRP